MKHFTLLWSLYKGKDYECRCAVVQIFCIKRDTINNKEVQELSRIGSRRVGELHNLLKDTKSPRKVVDRVRRTSDSSETVRTPDFVRKLFNIF